MITLVFAWCPGKRHRSQLKLVVEECSDHIHINRWFGIALWLTILSSYLNIPNGRSRCLRPLRRVNGFGRYDLKQGAFDPAELPEALLYFNQASPSAYVRGNTGAVPLALALMRSLEVGAREC